jgi:hypothetical protein
MVSMVAGSLGTKVGSTTGHSEDSEERHQLQDQNDRDAAI